MPTTEERITEIIEAMKDELTTPSEYQKSKMATYFSDYCRLKGVLFKSHQDCYTIGEQIINDFIDEVFVIGSVNDALIFEYIPEDW